MDLLLLVNASLLSDHPSTAQSTHTDFFLLTHCVNIALRTSCEFQPLKRLWTIKIESLHAVFGRCIALVQRTFVSTENKAC